MKVNSYKPLPKQLEFHNLKTKYKALIGGFGSGKTKSGIWESIDLCMRYPNNIGMICRKRSVDLRDTTQKMFFEECPKELIKRYIKSERRVIFINNSEIIFRGVDEEEKRRGLNLGFFYIDEASEVSADIFNMLQGRLRLSSVPKHYGFLTSNPPNIDHWIYKYFVENNHPDYGIVRMASYDNVFLPPDYIESLKRSYPESWVRRYIEGEFGFAQRGQPVFSGFSEKMHVTELRYMPAKPVLRGWDFGFRRPACVWVQIDNDDRVCVLKELLGNNEYLNDFADKVIKMSNIWFPDAKFEDYVDASGMQKSDKTSLTSIDILKNKGLKPMFRRIPVNSGLMLIQKKITTLIGDKPGLLINTDCRILKEALLGGYYYSEDSNKDEPYKDGFYEHIVDALRYIFNVVYGIEKKEVNIRIPAPAWF